jgi:hypothetical protein
MKAFAKKSALVLYALAILTVYPASPARSEAPPATGHTATPPPRPSAQATAEARAILRAEVIKRQKEVNDAMENVKAIEKSLADAKKDRNGALFTFVPATVIGGFMTYFGVRLMRRGNSSVGTAIDLEPLIVVGAGTLTAGGVLIIANGGVKLCFTQAEKARWDEALENAKEKLEENRKQLEETKKRIERFESENKK